MSGLLTEFHFLRSELLLLLPLPILLGFMLRAKAQASNTWDKLLPAEFLQVLATDRQPIRKGSSAWGWPLILSIAIIALAGPTWSKQETPVTRNQSSLVIVFDLSLSMLATDQSPNRLTRARQKVYDLLELRKEGQTGLVVFAGSSHVVSPLTEDTNTLRALLPALDPFIMPQLGSNLGKGINQAMALFGQAGATSGRILVLADGLENDDIPLIEDIFADSPYELSIIAMGSADGGPIPIPGKGFLKVNQEIVVAKPNFAEMKQLAASVDGLYSTMTIANRDLEQVLPAINLPDILSGHSSASEADPADSTVQTTSQQWHDSGYWILLLLVPLVLWQYRQAGAMLAILILLPTQQADALDWQDLWKTPDQQGMEAYQQQQFEDAAGKFADPMWSGTAHYRAGNYEGALNAFSQDESASAYFNRGNSLVELQRFEDALAAYDRALELNPQLNKAKANRDQLSEWLKQQQQNQKQQSQKQQNQQQQDQQQNQQASENEDNEGNEGNEGNEKSQDSQQPSSQPQNADQSGEGQQTQTNTDQQNSSTAEQAKANAEQAKANAENSAGQQAATEEEKEQQQAEAADIETNDEETENARAAKALAKAATLEDQQTEQWLRRIPDDPGGLLRRKFLQQYQNQGSRDSRTETKGSRSIW